MFDCREIGAGSSSGGAAVTSGADGEDCSMTEFESGDGIGGTEELLGSVGSYEECITLVRTERPEANGATIVPGGVGSCYAEFGMTGRSGGSSYVSAIFDCKPAGSSGAMDCSAT